MIKEIIFKDTSNFASKPISVSFSKSVNVIIGPKGGGKSTLFDLIAGLKNNYICDTVIKALESYNLKFEKAIKFSNEEILVSQLTKKKKKEKEDDYKNRNDVIYQDDQIKKDLTSVKEIEDKKFDYLKKQIEISSDVDFLISNIKNLYLSMNKLHDYFKNEIVDINWTNTFMMDQLLSNDSLGLLTKLDYKQNDIKNLINEELDIFKFFILSIEEFNTKVKRVQNFKKDKIINDQDFEQKINYKLDEIVKNNLDVIKLINEREFLLKKINLFSKLFLNSYKKIINKIKNENYSSDGLRSYEIKAKNHFRNLARNIHKTITIFEKMFSEELILNINNDMNQKDALIYKIPENIKINNEIKSEILKTVFVSPGNSIEDITKWLKSLTEKGIKGFKEELIRNCLARELKNEVKVLVDFGNEKKDYESLSLGQKSIYGLKYKFNKSLNDNLYLDQPEDNLDNNTIAQEILPMFDKKKDQQVVIVTHNANIGILSNPEKVIIADLNNKDEPYKIAQIKEIINNQSAHFLEGGKEYLEQRYNKIIKNLGEK